VCADSSAPVEARITDLLSRMTLEWDADGREPGAAGCGDESVGRGWNYLHGWWRADRAGEGSQGVRDDAGGGGGDGARGDQSVSGYLQAGERVSLKAGEVKTVTLPLAAKALAYWSDEAKGFVVEKDRVEVKIGGSSDDLPVKAVVEVR
jgi:hypothetical protein